MQKKVGAGRPSMSETKKLPTVPVVHNTRCQLCEIAIVTSVRASFHGICKMVIPCRTGDQTISVSNWYKAQHACFAQGCKLVMTSTLRWLRVSPHVFVIYDPVFARLGVKQCHKMSHSMHIQNDISFRPEWFHLLCFLGGKQATDCCCNLSVTSHASSSLPRAPHPCPNLSKWQEQVSALCKTRLVVAVSRRVA